MGIAPKDTREKNARLLAPLSNEKIRAALFDMHPLKAPGPDGFHALFYQRYWHIVGDEISQFVRQLWRGEVPIDPINHTNVTLIPKVRSPNSIVNFRPFSICNVIYKVFSKVLSNRLKLILPNIISDNQSAFVPDRPITDNAIIALECFHTMKSHFRARKGTMAIKLDMSKAYNRVEWAFLKKFC